jgi:hypothetical protein
MPESPVARPFYEPSRIDYLLRNWATICILAETPQSARGLLQPGETREAPRLKRPHGYHGDGLAWADVVADIERAWSALLEDRDAARLRWKVIGLRMQGQTLGQIASSPHVQLRWSVVGEIYRAACADMAVTLEGAHPEGSMRMASDR